MPSRSRHAHVAQCSGAGFTLVEVLVVVSIISLLLAIMFPSLRHARDTAKGVKCLSNLRQMTVAAHTYAHEHEDRYPIALYWQSVPVLVSYAWDFTTTKDWSTRPPTVRVTLGLLWQGAGTEQVHQCPAFVGAHNWQADPYTGYNYNTSYIGHGAGESIPDPAMVSEVRTPERTALFGDGGYAGGANKFMRAPWANPGDLSFSGRQGGTQDYRHLVRTNVAFCDGHAEAWKPRHTDTYPADRANIAAGTGFLSSDNSMYDLK
ncbi:MAG: type II secretion system protein [bacterium]|nr:type II secretion system protein [bacterium]